MKMKIKKGDKVLIIAGKDRNKTGKVLKVFPSDNRIMVENVNLAKKHQRSKKQGQKGQVISLPRPIDASNAKVICTKCGKAARIGHEVQKLEGKRTQRFRICKKCKAEI